VRHTFPPPRNRLRVGNDHIVGIRSQWDSYFWLPARRQRKNWTPLSCAVVFLKIQAFAFYERSK
jgi:hypothetical protein